MRKKAEAGDEEAAKKLEEMENTQMMEVVEDDKDVSDHDGIDDGEKQQDDK